MHISYIYYLLEVLEEIGNDASQFVGPLVLNLLIKVMDNYGKGRPSVMKTTGLLLDKDGWRGFYRGFRPSFLNMSVSRLTK